MHKSRLFSYISLPAVYCSVFAPTFSALAEKFQDENKVVEAFTSRMALEGKKWMHPISQEEIFLISLKESEIAKKLKKEEGFRCFLENLREVIRCRTIIFNYIKSVYVGLFHEDSNSTISSLMNFHKLIVLPIEEYNTSGEKEQKSYKNIMNILDTNGEDRSRELEAFFKHQLLKTLELIEKNCKEDPDAIRSYLRSEEDVLSFFKRLTALEHESLFMIYTFYKDSKVSKIRYLTDEEKSKITPDGNDVCTYMVKVNKKEYLLSFSFIDNRFVIKSLTKNKTCNIDKCFFNFFTKLLESSKFTKEMKRFLEKEKSASLYEKFFSPFFENVLINKNFFLLDKINFISINFGNSQEESKPLGKLKLHKKTEKKENYSKFPVKSKNKSKIFSIKKGRPKERKLMDEMSLNLAIDKKEKKDMFFLRKKRKFFNVIEEENNCIKPDFIHFDRAHNKRSLEANNSEDKAMNPVYFKAENVSNKKGSAFSVFKKQDNAILEDFEKRNIGSDRSSSFFSNGSYLPIIKRDFSYNYFLGNMLNNEPEDQVNLFGGEKLFSLNFK